MSDVSVINDHEIEKGTSLTDISVGTVFLGTLEDNDGESCSGVFIRTHNYVVFVDQISTEFADVDDYYGDSAATVVGYREVDITVSVDYVYPSD